jgi:hypothetical protein
MCDNISNFNTNRQKISLPNQSFFHQLKEFLDCGKAVTISVRGNSMIPFLKDGDKVLIIPGDGNLPKIGQVVLARTTFGVVLHRVVLIKGGCLCLAGDANLVQIEEIKLSDVIGIVNAAYRSGKELDISSRRVFFTALLWYKVRPVRRLLYFLLRTVKQRIIVRQKK